MRRFPSRRGRPQDATALGRSTIPITANTYVHAIEAMQRGHAAAGSPEASSIVAIWSPPWMTSRAAWPPSRIASETIA